LVLLALGLNAYLSLSPTGDIDGTARGPCGFVIPTPPFGSRPFDFPGDFWGTSGDTPLFLANGTMGQGPLFMPLACWEILNTDVVSDRTGPDCNRWCNEALGHMSMHPMCMSLPHDGVLFRSCFKAQIWSTVFFGVGKSTSLFFALGYTACSVILSLVFIYLRDTSKRRHSANEIQADENMIQTDGPFRSGSGEFPMCLPVSTDWGGLRLRLVRQGLGILGDPCLDVNAFMSFMSQGQIVYGGVMFVAIFVPHRTDPFQTGGVSCLIVSWQERSPRRGLYEHLVLEGTTEAVISIVLGMLALTRRAVVGEVDLYSTVSLGLCVITSVLFTIPDASRARFITQNLEEADFVNFYEFERKKASVLNRIPWLRHMLPSIDALAFGGVIARTIPTVALLAQLWAIGAIGGMLVWLSEKCWRGERPSCHQLIVHMITFACWPLSMSALSGLRSVSKSLGTEGSEDEHDHHDFHNLPFHGLSSLHPKLFYLHHIFTFTSFWILCVFNGNFITTLWENLYDPHYNYQQAFIFFVIGWVALFLEIVSVVILWSDLDSEWELEDQGSSSESGDSEILLSDAGSE